MGKTIEEQGPTGLPEVPESMLRGLGRTTLTGRRPDGSPITEEGLRVEALLKALQNPEKAEGEIGVING